MLRKTTLMAGLATLFFSTPVQALEHQILVLSDAYFPQTSYVSAGDTLIFINQANVPITVTSVDEQWSTGSLATEQDGSIFVVEGMTTDFFLEGSEDENGEPAVTGIISFIDAPLDNTSEDSGLQAEETLAPVN